MFIKHKTFNTSTLFLFSNTQKSLRMDAGLISAPWAHSNKTAYDDDDDGDDDYYYY